MKNGVSMDKFGRDAFDFGGCRWDEGFSISIGSLENPSTSLAPFPPLENPIRFPIRRVSRFLGSRSKNHAFSLGLDRGANDTSTSNYTINGEDEDYHRIPLTMLHLMYLVEVRLGSRKVPAHMLLDTGSSLIWLQCFLCRRCYKQNDPKFLPSESESYSDVNCFSSLCPRDETFYEGCIHGDKQNCGYRLSYSDGDQISGRIGRDDLSNVDGSFAERLTFGCVESNEGKLYGGEYAGILGFGFGEYTFPSQVRASYYSFCLISSDNRSKESFLYLHDSPPPTGNGPGAIAVPLMVNNHKLNAHYVSLFGIEIGKQTVKINSERWNIDGNGNYGVTLDTGTIITKLPADEYAIFRDTFREEFREYESFMVNVKPDDLLDTCYDFIADEDDYIDDLPEVRFYFFDPRRKENSALTLGWKQVMVELIRNNTHVRYCLAFGVFSSASWNVTMIGTYQLQGTRLSYDTAKMTLSFDPDEC